MTRSWFIALTSIVTLCLLSACLSQNAQPPKMFQVCLGADRDVDLFLGNLESLARKNKMTFVNRSLQSHQELIRLGKDPGYRVINVSASRSDGLGVAAGNLGLGAHEMAVGVTNGSDPKASADFVHALIEELENSSAVHTVPTGQGALPSGKCKQG